MHQEGIFRDLIDEYGSHSADTPSEVIESKTTVQAAGVKIHLDEERETGEIGWTVYSAWFTAVRSRTLLTTIALTLSFGQVATVGSSLWLAFWSQDAFRLAQGQYIGVYGGLGALVVCFGVSGNADEG
jgi:hypothetical protein